MSDCAESRFGKSSFGKHVNSVGRQVFFVPNYRRCKITKFIHNMMSRMLHVVTRTLHFQVFHVIKRGFNVKCCFCTRECIKTVRQKGDGWTEQ